MAEAAISNDGGAVLVVADPCHAVDDIFFHPLILTPPDTKYSALWYLIGYWEYLIFWGPGGVNVRRGLPVSQAELCRPSAPASPA